MGNTIRREPVNFDIPDSPDYKFLNITDFRGIAISDNPFTLSSNTASDMLNLYVDETNTLTTRPRLERFVSLKKDHPNLTKFLGWYPLSFGFLVHYIEGVNSYTMNIAIEVNGELTYYEVNNGGTIKGEKLIVFEQNDNIYILDGNNYYVITYTLENNVLSDTNCSLVEGYIPTVSVGGTNLVDGQEYEPYNILSNKYKKSYFWDGTWDPNTVLNSSDSVYEYTNLVDSYSSQIHGNINGNCQILKFINSENSDTNIFYEKPRFLGELILTRYPHVSSLFIGHYEETSSTQNNLIIDTNIILPEYLSDKQNISATCSYDGTHLLVYGIDSASDFSIGVKRGDVWYNITSLISDSFNYSSTKFNQHYISDDGNIIYLFNTPDILKLVFNEETLIYELKKTITPEFTSDIFDLTHLKAGLNGRLIVCASMPNGTNIDITVSYDEGENFDKLSNPLIVNENNHFDRDIQISSDGNIILVGPILFKDFLTTLNNYEILPLTNTSSYYVMSDVGDKIFCLTTTEELTSQTGYLSVNHTINENGNRIYDNYFIKIPLLMDSSSVKSWQDNQPYTRKIYNNMIVTAGSEFILDQSTPYNNQMYNVFNINFDSIEPTLFVTYEINQSDDDYSNWLERQELFKKSLLTCRFDNQRWFAVKNSVFRTSNNDPTYIPITNYSSLGETDENITGFNLVQDDLLVVYKDNYIWAVSPMTYTQNNITYYDYNYQETKNTVGNNAIGASIVSAYSELPLQITYDGIYALSQLSNVYASDRISESISDNIAKKWQKEDKNIVQKAQTLNRLYWTYVILSYKKITKVYLLDNRTASWFYWELPISVVNAFVKDNIVYLSDIDGTIYTLRTSDIINKYNPNTTEYYDDGEQIITWFWKSQILPLGTINYSKRLIDTTFIFTDTDSTDEYSLDYTFTAYRKVVSKTNATTLSNQLNYIQSTTKKTLINRCNFIQLELSNTVDDLNNNKLRLVGLGFKYILLEGLL